jgi:3-hydroxybutyryl-CoA dehydratase
MARTFASLKVGDKESVTKKITSEVIFAFADVSEDRNPLHLDDNFAKTTQFGQRIAHGMISAGLLSAAHTKYPGDGAVYMSQTLKFRRPVYIDDTLTAWTELKEKVDDKKRLITKDSVVNQKGEVVVEGEAMILFDR